MASQKTLLIIDGHAVLHRAWHALPSMTAPDGKEVRGAYGFTTMLLGSIKEFKPDFVAVAMDLPGGTFRNEMYEEYKATREKKPDELYAQTDVIEEILAAFNIPVYAVKGFEADDVIGTITAVAPKQDKSVRCVIATGDQDSFQLIDKKTQVYMPRRRDGKTVMTLVTEEIVKEDFGFAPKTLIDYKALRGDSSDNIPGVKGIGEVTAKQLLAEFGSVPKLYAALEKGGKKVEHVKERTRELLLGAKKDAMLALDLCTIRRDVPLDFHLETAAFVPAKREQVAATFTKLGFMKLLQQFPNGSAPTAAKEGKTPSASNATLSLFDAGAPSAAAPATGTADARAAKEEEFDDVRSTADVDAMLKALARPVRTAFRFLTDDDAYAPRVTMAAFTDGKTVWVLDEQNFTRALPLLAAYFTSGGDKACHDVKRAHKTLEAAGMRGALTGAFDVMIASYFLQSGERKHDLEALLAYGRGIQLDDTVKDAPPEAHRDRLVVETRNLLPLMEDFSAQLDKNGLRDLFGRIGMPLAATLARMERTGVGVDVPYLERLSKELGKRIDALTEQIHADGGDFNINSPAQLQEVLFDRLGISTLGLKKTAKGGSISTAASELEKLKDKHAIIGRILEYRELTKLKSTYVDAIPQFVNAKTGRVHAEFNQTVAATGRLSSSNPNMQNIPTPETEEGRKVRSAFVAPKGKTLIAADYSQFELRIVAHIAQEPVMIQAFRAGEDIHWRTAVAMFGEEDAASKRRIAKAINFGILYGMGPQRLAESADISFLEAKQYIDQYFALHKGITKYVSDTEKKLADDGFVETLYGRKRFFKNVRLMNPRERAEAERQAVNMPVQGSQADIIQDAMIRMDRVITEKYPKGEVRMISQVHDELLFEADADAVDGFIPVMQDIMENTFSLDVPIAVNVSTGVRWGEMEKRM